MSIPISYCRLVRALDSKEELESLRKTMAYNLSHGAFSFILCNHNPPHRHLTDEEWDKLEQLLGEGDG